MNKVFTVYYRNGWNMNDYAEALITTADEGEAVRARDFLNEMHGGNFAWISMLTLGDLYYKNFQYLQPFKLRLYHDKHGMSWEVLKHEPSDAIQFAHVMKHGPYIEKELWMLDKQPEFAKHDYTGFVFANNSEAAAFTLMRWINYFERTGKMGAYDERGEIIQDFKYEKVEMTVRSLARTAQADGYIVNRCVAKVDGSESSQHEWKLINNPFGDQVRIYVYGFDDEKHTLYMNDRYPDDIIANYEKIFVTTKNISLELGGDYDGDWLSIVSEAYGGEMK